MNDPVVDDSCQIPISVTNGTHGIIISLLMRYWLAINLHTSAVPISINRISLTDCRLIEDYYLFMILALQLRNIARCGGPVPPVGIEGPWNELHNPYRILEYTGEKCNYSCPFTGDHHKSRVCTYACIFKMFGFTRLSFASHYFPTPFLNQTDDMEPRHLVNPLSWLTQWPLGDLNVIPTTQISILFNWLLS